LLIVEFMRARYELVIAMLAKEMKRKMTMEIVNNSRTRRKFKIIKIKKRKYFVKPIIHINNRTFDSFLLLWSKQIQ